jgi:hypothetical protein
VGVERRWQQCDGDGDGMKDTAAHAMTRNSTVINALDILLGGGEVATRSLSLLLAIVWPCCHQAAAVV